MILLPQVQTTDPNTTVQLSDDTLPRLSKHNALIHASLDNLNKNQSRFNAGEQLERQVRRRGRDVGRHHRDRRCRRDQFLCTTSRRPHSLRRCRCAMVLADARTRVAPPCVSLPMYAQYSVFNVVIGFVNETLASGSTSRTALYGMVYSLLPQVTANINEAAASQVTK